jgi:hypothetical protein
MWKRVAGILIGLVIIVGLSFTPSSDASLNAKCVTCEAQECRWTEGSGQASCVAMGGGCFSTGQCTIVTVISP